MGASLFSKEWTLGRPVVGIMMVTRKTKPSILIEACNFQPHSLIYRQEKGARDQINHQWSILSLILPI